MKYKIIRMKQGQARIRNNTIEEWIDIDIQPVVAEMAFGQLIALKVSGALDKRPMKDICKELDAWFDQYEVYIRNNIDSTTKALIWQLDECNQIQRGGVVNGA